uniref:Uncharacterized protein n=1 Tax=Thermorudis peleae TaxID=1382356 RepID=A0A831WZE2_9BACT
MAGEERRTAYRDGSALREALARSRHRTVNLEPSSTYEVVTRQMVEEVARELAEIRARLNQLTSLIVGAITLEVLLRVTGLG